MKILPCCMRMYHPARKHMDHDIFTDGFNTTYRIKMDMQALCYQVPYLTWDSV